VVDVAVEADMAAVADMAADADPEAVLPAVDFPHSPCLVPFQAADSGAS